MVRWESGRRSDNVDDRRGMGGGPRMAIGGGGGILMLVLVFFLTGGDVGKVLQFLLMNQGGRAFQQDPQARRAPDPNEDRQADFSSVILADTEEVWTRLFAQMGRTYHPPQMVLFEDQVRSGCGLASASSGPFYCPADKRVYLDLRFYDELSRKFGAPGDFAQAYVIAHEIGHHVQNELGMMNRREELLNRMSENEFSVRLELQADFLAGVWAHHADKQRHILEKGDIEEGLRAASAIGDDTLQKRSQGYVVQESFTHGSAAQRVRWFKKGYETGDIAQGDTFATNDL